MRKEPAARDEFVALGVAGWPPPRLSRRCRHVQPNRRVECMSETDRNGTPFGKWQDRYIGWFRDLGSLQKPGGKTKAASEIGAFLNQRQHGADRGATSGQSTRST